MTTAEGVDARDLRSAFTSGAFTAALVDAAIDAAARVWKDGRCLELVVEPPGKEVDPGSETEITVTIEHKAFEDEIKRDIRATALEGTEKVEPFDQPVPAEATFTYTATSESQGEGTITFRSVSNRGIAERTETYTVSQRLLLDAEGSLTMEAGGMTIPDGRIGAVASRSSLVPGETPDAPPRVSVEGELALRGRDQGPPWEVQLHRATSGRPAPVDAAADVSAQIFGEGEDRRLSVHLTPRDPNATIDFPMRCRFPTGPTTVPHSIRVARRVSHLVGPGDGRRAAAHGRHGDPSPERRVGAIRLEPHAAPGGVSAPRRSRATEAERHDVAAIVDPDGDADAAGRQVGAQLGGGAGGERLSAVAWRWRAREHARPLREGQERVARTLRGHPPRWVPSPRRPDR